MMPRMLQQSCLIYNRNKPECFVDDIPHKSNVRDNFQVQHDRQSISFLANILVGLNATTATSGDQNSIANFVYFSFTNKCTK